MTARKNTTPKTLSRGHHVLAGVVVTGAVVIAGIGFAGSYAAVRDLALDKGFGRFANVFPIGIDAGIVVLLALDLLLTWIRIPFPLLRQTAWLLTAATIAFNGAAAWPDPVGVGMHAVIPILFVVSVEAARHAVGRIADITADRHMESVRITRWLLAPIPTFRLWRRMKLWELRSYEEVIRLEQDRLVYQARLRARYGRAWRRKAPVESLMPLRLARYGVPLADTAPAGLAAAGLDPTTVSATALPPGRASKVGPDGMTGVLTGANDTPAIADTPPQQPQRQNQQTQELPLSLPLPVYQQPGGQQGHDGRNAVPFDPAATHPAPVEQQVQQPQQLQEPQQPQQLQPEYQQIPGQAAQPEQLPQQPQPQQAQPQLQQHQLTVPVGPGGRVRPLGGEGLGSQQGVYVPEQREPERYAYEEQPGQPMNQLPDDVPHEEVYYATFRQFLADHSRYPSAYQFGQRLRETYGVNDLTNNELTAYIENFKQRQPTGARHSRSDRHSMNGHDHPMAIPEQRGQPRTGHKEKPARGPELSQPRRKDPTGDALPAGHHTSGDATSAPPIETATEPPAPPLEKQGAGPPLEPPKKPEPEQKADEQPPAVETVADRYYTAWRAYREKHGTPPNGDQLSQWLYNGGVTGRNGKAVSPSTLRRYIASYPCYETWAEHADSHGQEPTAEELEKLLADRGIKRNNGGLPWELTDLEHLLPHFQKRRRLHSSS